jgi:hypothetical protein
MVFITQRKDISAGENRMNLVRLHFCGCMITFLNAADVIQKGVTNGATFINNKTYFFKKRLRDFLHP